VICGITAQIRSLATGLRSTTRSLTKMKKIIITMRVLRMKVQMWSKIIISNMQKPTNLRTFLELQKIKLGFHNWEIQM
jgi:TATA-box binding protein (TBP) (component of TFIID and TFIIIB)